MTYLVELLTQYGVFAVFAWVLIEQAGVPLPAYPMLMVAGSLAATGQLSMPLLVLVTVLACLIADYSWYLAGNRFGGRVLRLMCRLSLTPDSCVNQTESVFDRWGPRSLIVAKFIPGFASVATAMAGATKVARPAFLAYDFIGSLLWAGVGLSLGWMFAPAVEVVLLTLQRLGHWGAGLLAVATMIYIARKAWNRINFRKHLRLERLTISELKDLQHRNEDLIIVDVRKRELWEKERIPGSILFNAEDWKSVVGHPHSRKIIVTYCDCPAEASAAIVARSLGHIGFNQVYPLAGGLEGWTQADIFVKPESMSSRRP
jgi:membrane protein DedA with SNARE-associated domain/rhodanese-related sulfurtransferase